MPVSFLQITIRKYNKNILIVCTDADDYSVEGRLQLLFKKTSCNSIMLNEPIMFWIPKRHIETWIHYLKGEKGVNENTNYRHDTPIKCKPESEKMSQLFQANEIEDLLPSMISAYKGYGRICGMQN